MVMEFDEVTAFEIDGLDVARVLGGVVAAEDAAIGDWVVGGAAGMLRLTEFAETVNEKGDCGENDDALVGVECEFLRGHWMVYLFRDSGL
jgi:hypothetical protein